MTSIAKAECEFADFSVREWHRLDTLSMMFDRAFKTTYLRAVTVGPKQGEKIVRDAIADCVVETAVGTAHVYGMGFDATEPRYTELVNDLTTGFMKVVNNEEAKDKVRAILPSGLSLSERADRSDVYGLSSRDAVRLERMRQKGISGLRLQDARLHMQVQRGNITALTEVNRIINQTVETVWLDNMSVSKARKSQMLLEHAGKVTAITSLRGIPARARKTIVTRKDNRVCDYCAPLENIETAIGASFHTEYGVFAHPPFHPRCRCFMILRY